MDIPLYFGGLAGVTCSVPVADIGLHFVPDKPTRDSSESRGVNRRVRVRDWCRRCVSSTHVEQLAVYRLVEMSHNTVKSWKCTSSSLRPVIAVRYVWISSEVALVSSKLSIINFQ